MIKYQVSGTLTKEEIYKINKLYPNQNIIIVFENTKYQKANDLAVFSDMFPNIRYSVLGGLNPTKRKFNNEHYQERTYYTGRELSRIIKIYEAIERKIVLSWTETQKVMFVYRELCNMMEYSEVEINNRDYARGIGGLLYNKAVCSGFAMILKEALDRLGIENYYQNKEGHHSWNIAKVDGKYRAFELTWDTDNKTQGRCGFRYFNQNKDFYGNKHHNIDDEKEEIKFPITPYTFEELSKDLAVISSSRVLHFNLENNATDIKYKNINFKIMKMGNTITLNTSDNSLIYRQYIRRDNSSFIIIPTDIIYKGTYQYLVFELGNNCVKCAKIYSENKLEILPKDYDNAIANGLLSKERLKNKINNFNGYVGYVGTNYSIYYDENFEKENLNILR